MVISFSKVIVSLLSYLKSQTFEKRVDLKIFI